MTIAKAHIIEFLDKMIKDGHMEKNTANARKAAVVKVCTVLDELELHEDLDLNSFLERFQLKAKADLRSESLKSYSARFRTAFNEYIAWSKNPAGYKPDKRKRGRPQNSVKKSPVRKTSGSLGLETNPNKLVKYPLVTKRGLGSIEIPLQLSEAEVSKLIALTEQLFKSHLFEQEGV